MEFCKKCNSKLIKKKIGSLCPNCDRFSLEEINQEPKETVVEKYVKGQEFPFEKNQYFPAKIVRKTFGCSVMHGINYNEEGHFLIIFMNAHAPGTNENNPYPDFYDPNLRIYHYFGRGRDGDQTLTGVNGILEKSNEKNIDIHFFRQYHIRHDHEYVGKVKLLRVVPNTLTDKHGEISRAYEFLLRPVE